jgi:hypothetical protein
MGRQSRVARGREGRGLYSRAKRREGRDTGSGVARGAKPEGAAYRQRFYEIYCGGVKRTI